MNRVLQNRYKDAFNFIFSGITLFDGKIIGSGDIKDLLKHIIKTNISDDEIGILQLNCFELFAIQQLLRNTTTIPYIDCFNYILKVNDVFNIIFGSPIFKAEDLTYYRNIFDICINSHWYLKKSTIVYIDYKIQNNTLEMRDINNEFLESSNDLYLLVGLLNQIIAIYQLMYQTREMKKKKT